jgi:HJR/Mrr/RecB family endonuclease
MMETILELLTTAGRFLVGMWPVMFVVLLFGIFKRRDGFGTMIRLSIKSLVIAWVFFAVLRVVFNYFHMDTLQLIQEPENTRYFLIVGLFLLPLALAIVFEEARKRRTIKSIEDMQLLSPSEFEKLVAKTYREQGHSVEIVGATGDHGIDLVVHTNKGETWLVQCKKYRGKVGEPVVRDFYGVLRASNADAGAIVTTGLITPQARLWAEGKPIFLYDGRAFLKIIESTRLRRVLPQEVRKPEPATPARQGWFGTALKTASATASVAAPMTLTGMVEHSAEMEPQDKTPFSKEANIPDCPVCGTSMILKTTPRFLLKPKKTYICVNAPECEETFPVE